MLARVPLPNPSQEKCQTREEIKLKQKSRELWLQEGDRNSRFFHTATLIKRRRYNISEILLDNGQRIMIENPLRYILNLPFKNCRAPQILAFQVTLRI